MRIAKTLIRLGGCPGWSESSLGAKPFCWFCHVAAHIMSNYRLQVNLARGMSFFCISLSIYMLMRKSRRQSTKRTVFVMHVHRLIFSKKTKKTTTKKQKKSTTKNNMHDWNFRWLSLLETKLFQTVWKSTSASSMYRYRCRSYARMCEEHYTGPFHKFYT